MFSEERCGLRAVCGEKPGAVLLTRFERVRVTLKRLLGGQRAGRRRRPRFSARVRRGSEDFAGVDENAGGPSHHRRHLVFIGHVDAGKSTMGGNILYLCGMVDKRTMEKYEREAKEAGRDSWYLSWALDSTPQERAKV